MPAGAARQSSALCTSWQVLPRAKQLRSRLERCLAVRFSFSSRLLLRAAAAFLCCYSIPGAVAEEEEAEVWEEAGFQRAANLRKEREDGAGKWWSGLTLALLCCPAGC